MGQSEIRSFKEVCRICHKLQKEGKKVVFCHGFFDILHRGHVELLVRAKKLGDILVVGVDHDDNAKILKGPKRPINDHDSRMFLLSNLEAVDYVFLIRSVKKNYILYGKKSLYDFYTKVYSTLKPNLVATCIKAGKYGPIRERQAKECSIGFVDINHGVYDKNTSKTVKLLELD